MWSSVKYPAAIFWIERGYFFVVECTVLTFCCALFLSLELIESCFGMTIRLSLCDEKTAKLNPFPHTDAFWRFRSRRLLKILWQKEKLLITQCFHLFSIRIFYFKECFKNCASMFSKSACWFVVCAKRLKTSKPTFGHAINHRRLSF